MLCEHQANTPNNGKPTVHGLRNGQKIYKITDLIIYLTKHSLFQDAWYEYICSPLGYIQLNSRTVSGSASSNIFKRTINLFFRKRLCFGHSKFLSWRRAVTQVGCTITNLSEQYMLNYSNGKRWRGSLHSKLWLTSFGFGSHLKKITFIFSRYGSVLSEVKGRQTKHWWPIAASQVVRLKTIQLSQKNFILFNAAIEFMSFLLSLNIQISQMTLSLQYIHYTVLINQFYGQFLNALLYMSTLFISII